MGQVGGRKDLAWASVGRQYLHLVPFYNDLRYGHSFEFIRNKDGSLDVFSPSEEFQEVTINRQIAYLSGLLPEDPLNQADDTLDPKKLAVTCADATEKTKGYWSHVVVQDRSVEDDIRAGPRGLLTSRGFPLHTSHGRVALVLCYLISRYAD